MDANFRTGSWNNRPVTAILVEALLLMNDDPKPEPQSLPHASGRTTWYCQCGGKASTNGPSPARLTCRRCGAIFYLNDPAHRGMWA
ncbi:hypothetical protein GCM10023319_35200 [Nocardia iowensis]